MYTMYRLAVVTVAVFLAYLGGLVAQASAQAPIPSRPQGFFYNNGSCDAPVQIESWVDLICPDSKAAWLTYQKVADFYGPQRVRFSALVFPLPYHRAAMLAAQATFVADKLNSKKTYAWLNSAFENQAMLSDDVIFDQPESFIVDTLCDWASELGFSRNSFKSHLARSDPTNQVTRVEFKYGATRGVYGTPQSFINGVIVNADPTWTLDDWKQVIDPILIGQSNIL